MNSPNDESLLKLLADLIGINSVNPNYEGGVPEAEMADYVEQYFVQRGIETWRQIVYPNRPNVLARIPGRDSSRRIVLEAHMDTVATVGMSIAPWTPEIRDGKMYGRGSCDTKGGMAAMMHALACLVHHGQTPPCDVLFAATIDEEFSYRGVVALCDSLAAGPVDPLILETEVPARNPWHAEAAIVAEPTELAPVIASKGLVRWKIETRGRAAHSAKPHLGINAIEHMALLIRAIEEDNRRLAKHIHPLLGAATCNIGLIRGGVQINFVPDRCEIELDRRLLPGETRDRVLADYQRLIDRVVASDPAMDVIMHPPMLSDRPLETDSESPAVKTLVRVLDSLGHASQPIGVPFCSDASKFGAIGIPSMILGPGSIDQAHAAVEFIQCDQVIACAEIYRQFVLQYN